MDLGVLEGKAFTLWLTDEMNDSAVFAGTSRWDGQTLTFERDDHPSFEIRPEWYERIFPVGDEESREILLGAEYCLRLSVGTTESIDKNELEATGLRWPE